MHSTIFFPFLRNKAQLEIFIFICNCSPLGLNKYSSKWKGPLCLNLSNERIWPFCEKTNYLVHHNKSGKAKLSLSRFGLQWKVLRAAGKPTTFCTRVKTFQLDGPSKVLDVCVYIDTFVPNLFSCEKMRNVLPPYWCYSLILSKSIDILLQGLTFKSSTLSGLQEPGRNPLVIYLPTRNSRGKWLITRHRRRW